MYKGLKCIDLFEGGLLNNELPFEISAFGEWLIAWYKFIFDGFTFSACKPLNCTEIDVVLCHIKLIYDSK